MMKNVFEITKNDKTRIDELFNSIGHQLNQYTYDQYLYYPARKPNGWQEFLKQRLADFVSNNENILFWYAFNEGNLVIGIRLAEWDRTHFGFPIGNIRVYYMSENLHSKNIEEAIDQSLAYVKRKNGEFVSARIHGDNLSFIHALEKYEFRYIENVIWPVMKTNKHSTDGHDVSCTRMMNEHDLEDVKMIAKNFQYQRGHFHCDKAFDIEKVNSLYAKWIESAWERKENILLVIHEGKIAGYFVSAIDDNMSSVLGYTYGRLKSLALDGNFRGRGYGKILFNRTVGLLKKQGADVIDSGYSTKNHLSARLHHQLSFNSVYEEVTFHKWL